MSDSPFGRSASRMLEFGRPIPPLERLGILVVPIAESADVGLAPPELELEFNFGRRARAVTWAWPASLRSGHDFSRSRPVSRTVSHRADEWESGSLSSAPCQCHFPGWPHAAPRQPGPRDS